MERDDVFDGCYAGGVGGIGGMGVAAVLEELAQEKIEHVENVAADVEEQAAAGFAGVETPRGGWIGRVQARHAVAAAGDAA